MPQQLPDEILYDTRLIERHVARGLITRQAVELRRQAAPDVAEQADTLDLEQLAGSARRAAKRHG